MHAVKTLRPGLTTRAVASPPAALMVVALTQ